MPSSEKLVQAGVDIPTIMKINGHKSARMVLRYTHVHGQHIDKAIGVIETGLPKLLEASFSDLITHKLHKKTENSA